MTDTVVSNAAIAPHDEGLPNIADGNEDWNSAGLAGLLGKGLHGKCILGISGAGFSNHDATNDQVDLDAHVAVFDLNEAGSNPSVQSTLGGSSAPAYDTTLTYGGTLVAQVPAQADLAMTGSTLNDVYVCYATDGTETTPSAGDVYIRHGDSVSAPSTHPYIKHGTTNPDDSTAGHRGGYDNPPDSDGWREDPNSPFSDPEVSTSTPTINMIGRYDEVKLVVSLSNMNNSANAHLWDLQFNEITTSNYKVTTYGLNEIAGTDAWGMVATINTQEKKQFQEWTHFSLRMAGNWSTSGTAAWPKMSMDESGIHKSGGAIDAAMTGQYQADTAPPVESFTLVEQNGNSNWAYEARIFGRHHEGLDI